jgi:hypothetical protein
MGLDGSPKKFAEDVASGLISINRLSLKRYTPVEIQKIMVGVVQLSKEVRTQVVDTGDFNALKEKGMKTQRLNGAMMTIRAYAKENKFTVSG